MLMTVARSASSGLVLTTLLATGASATDRLVDATGAASPLTTVDQAMALCVPGDRILILPGSYPSFTFNRGVEVVGLGATPDQVLIEAIGYHINIPNQNYDTGLANVTVCGTGPDDGTGFSGNELGPGTLVLDGVQLCSGVYLRGAGEFYLLVHNSSVIADPGDGFLNAAFDFGGGVADFVDTRIHAAPASSSAGTPAGVALRVRTNTTVRVSGCEIVGGSGAPGGDAYSNGGDAIERANASVVANLRLSGGSLIRGGSAHEGGEGGAGVDLNGTILVGTAIVAGGTGSVPGAAYAGTQPTNLPYDPQLSAIPGHLFAQGATFLESGQSLSLVPDVTLPMPTIHFAMRLDDPASPDLSPLPPAESSVWMFDGPMGIEAPARRHAGPYRIPLRRTVFQGFFVDPATQAVVTTNPVVVTVLAR
jgi:hypothetical protein